MDNYIELREKIKRNLPELIEKIELDNLIKKGEIVIDDLEVNIEPDEFLDNWITIQLGKTEHYQKDVDEFEYQFNDICRVSIEITKLDDIYHIMNKLESDLRYNFSKNIYTQNIIGLKGRFHEVETVIIYSMFQCLSDFIVHQDGLNFNYYRKNSKMRKEIIELDNWWRDYQIKYWNGDRDEKVETKMMIRLIKIRDFLWT